MKNFVKICLVLSFVCFLPGFLASADGQTSAPKQSWPLFRGATSATGVAPGKISDKLKVAWKKKIKNGDFDGSPIIDKGVVYIGEGNGTLYAFDLKSGEQKWKFPKEKTTLGFVASAATQNGQIYIGDLDGILYCVDTRGELKWKFQVDGPITSSVNFYKDKVILGAEDAKLYCIDAKTGKKVWDFEAADEIRCMPTVVENRAFVTGCDGDLHIVNLDTGKEVSTVKLEAQTECSATAYGDKVYFGTGQLGFLSVNWKKSTAGWKFEESEQIKSNAAAIKYKDKTHVIFGTARRKVISLDAISGKTNWTFTARSGIDTSPVIVGNRVVVLENSGRMYLLDLVNGKKVFEKQFGGGFRNSPAVVDGKVVIATMRGTVYCLTTDSK